MINAYEYGKALFELAEEEGRAEALFEELSAVTDIFAGNPEYLTLLDTPAIPAREKPTLIDGALASCHVYVRDFVKLLASRRAVGQLSACLHVYGNCLDEARGIVRAVAKTAVPMSEAQMEKLAGKLSALTGKNAVLTNECDPSVIGGVSLVCDGAQFDGSIRARLEDLRAKLSEATI